MLTTADSERLVAWHVAPQSDRPVILYLQGNGGALRHRVRRFARLVQDGFGVVAISYRGFGGSTGSPSETGLLLDAAAGYVFCTDHYAAERIVVWGELLGTGVAVALASKQAGRTADPGSAVHFRRRGRAAELSADPGEFSDEGSVPLGCADRRDHDFDFGAARRAPPH